MKRSIPPIEGEELHTYWSRIEGMFGAGWYLKAWRRGEKFGCRWIFKEGNNMAIATYEVSNDSLRD